MIVKKDNKVYAILSEVKPGTVFEWKREIFLRIKSTRIEIDDHLYDIMAVDLLDGCPREIAEDVQVITYPTATYTL